MNYKIDPIFAALTFLFSIHYLVFSVKYLETGLKYVFLDNEAHLWVSYLLFFLYLPYLAFQMGVYLSEFAASPVFLTRTTDDLQCQEAYAAFEAEKNTF